MKLPSAKLLNAVLSDYSHRKGEVATSVELGGNYLDIYYDGNTEQCIPYGWNCINIYELMHLMKVWAWCRYGAVVISAIASLHDSLSFTFATAKIHYLDKADPTVSEPFTAETEFEAVTQACEWLLNQGGIK